MRKTVLGGIFIGIQLVTVIAVLVSIFASNKKNLVQCRAAMILNGPVDDLSWGQSHYEGMKAACEKFGVTLQVRESVMGVDECAWAIEDFIRRGCNIIVCDSIEFTDAVLEMAEKYPDCCFLHATGVEQGKNIVTYFGRIYQARYLSGIVAGLQTKSDTIGYVAAMKIPEVVRGINAFALGVHSVNPRARVKVVWTEDWVSDDAAESETEKLLRRFPSIDVLAIHTDSQRVLQIAEERGIWSIGYNIDNSALYPRTFLTAPVWNWEGFYTEQIEAVVKNKFYGRHYWFDETKGIFELSPLTGNVRDVTIGVVESAKARIEGGLFDVFYGPIYDENGVKRVFEGENIPDSVLLNEFDWFVKGVEVYEGE